MNKHPTDDRIQELKTLVVRQLRRARELPRWVREQGVLFIPWVAKAKQEEALKRDELARMEDEGGAMSA